MRSQRRLRMPHFRQHQNQVRADPLSGIEIPSPFDLQRFCTAVAERRGRPLLIEEVDGVNGADQELCGVWVELDTADCIFIEASTSPMHRDHIVLHEISHMLLRHSSVNGMGPGVDLGGLFTSIDPRTVRSVLGRANFTSPQEREAEQLATKIAQLAKPTPTSWSHNPELDRLSAALRGESQR